MSRDPQADIPRSAMPTNVLGRTRRQVSAISLGTWQLGADWGEVATRTRWRCSRPRSRPASPSSTPPTCTATAAASGRSRSSSPHNPGHDVIVATKMGRRVDQLPENYTLDNFRAWTDRSRPNLGVDTLDLVQLHCPPSAVIDATRRTTTSTRWSPRARSRRTASASRPSTRRCRRSPGPNVASIQIILNAFRLKPLDAVLPAAREAGVGIIARVPLASGLLSGATTRTRRSPPTTTAPTTATAGLRRGRDVLRGRLLPGCRRPGSSRRWPRAMGSPRQPRPSPGSPNQGVTTVIPGARNAEQATANAAAGLVADLGAEFGAEVVDLYDRYFRASVHQLW